MSSANPGRETARSAYTPRSIPIARVSRGRLALNVHAALSALGAEEPVIADVRADSWGHGPAAVGALLREGVRRFIADDPATRDLVEAGGATVVTAASATVDPLTVFGLPGATAGAAPALSLSGTVLGVKDLRRGEGVSYGYLYRAPVDTRVALVTGGYAQGIVRSLGGSIDVMIDGRRHRVVGRIAMDVCVAEVGDAPIRRGAEALFLGDPAAGEPSLQEWTDAAGMSAAELVTTIGLRAAREEDA